RTGTWIAGRAAAAWEGAGALAADALDARTRARPVRTDLTRSSRLYAVVGRRAFDAAASARPTARARLEDDVALPAHAVGFRPGTGSVGAHLADLGDRTLA